MPLWYPYHQVHRTTGREDGLPFSLVPFTAGYDPHPEVSIGVEQPPPTLDEMRIIFVCHCLIDLMPREALGEIFETIVDTYLDFQVPYQEPLALPPPDRERNAVYGDRVKSPPFVIDFDEV